MSSFSVTLVFLSLWVITLLAFIIYLSGHRKRHRTTIEKYLYEKDKSHLSLQKSEDRYNKLIANISQGLIFLDEKDQIRHANRYACGIFKLSCEKLVSHSIFDFVLSPSDNRKLKMPNELKKPGCSHKEEMQLVRGNGEVFWAILNICFLDNLHDFAPGSVIFINDITDKKRAEEYLHTLTVNLNQRVKQLDCLFEISELTYSPNLPLDKVMQESIEIIPFGLKYSGKIWVEINVEKHQYRSKNFKDTDLFYTAPIKGRKQTYGFLRVGYTGIEEANYKVFFNVKEKVFIRNISEKLSRMIDMRYMEQSLEEGLEKLNELHRIVHIGSWEIDLRSGKISYGFNFFDVMGADPGKRASYNLEAFYQQVHPEDRNMVREFEKRIFSGDHNDLTHIYRIRTHKGKMRYIFGNGKLLYDNQDKPIIIIGTIQDVTAEIQKLNGLP